MSIDPDAPVDFVLTDAGRAALAHAREQAAARYRIDEGPDGWTYLYCTQCTTRPSDYLQAYPGPAIRHTQSIAAVRQEHEHHHLLNE
jgi:hypothetical protein